MLRQRCIATYNAITKLRDKIESNRCSLSMYVLRYDLTDVIKNCVFESELYTDLFIVLWI